MKAFEDLIRLSCVEDDEVTKVTVKISGSSIKTTVEYPESSYDKEYFDDYMNSEFMYDFYKYLKNGNDYIPSVSELKYEDSSSIAGLVEDSVVTILSQTKTSVTFVFKEQTLSVKVGQFVRSEDSGKLSLDISYNGKTCSLVQESGYVTKSTCKVEYGEFYDKSSVKDANGNTITVAMDYNKSNRDEFDDCTEDLLDSVYAAVKRLKKDSDEDEEEGTDLDECYAYLDAYYDCDDLSSCNNYFEQYYDCISLDIAPSYSTSTDFIPKKDFLKRQQSLTNKLLKLSN